MTREAAMQNIEAFNFDFIFAGVCFLGYIDYVLSE
jgi:hypothetical protein